MKVKCLESQPFDGEVTTTFTSSLRHSVARPVDGGAGVQVELQKGGW